MSFRFIASLVLYGFLLLAFLPSSWACHKGGPMGFATKDPGMFSLDVTASTTFSFASTSGTSGCKDWDFYRLQQKDPTKLYGEVLVPILDQWHQLSEEAARGQGEHLNVLAQLMGCPVQRYPQFSALLHEHYPSLFESLAPLPHQERSPQFFHRLTDLLENTANLGCVSPS